MFQGAGGAACEEIGPNALLAMIVGFPTMDSAIRHAEADAELMKQIDDAKSEMAQELADNQAKENGSA